MVWTQHHQLPLAGEHNQGGVLTAEVAADEGVMNFQYLVLGQVQVLINHQSRGSIKVNTSR